MRRLTLLVVLVAFVFSCGGEWCVLQGIAWANMVREYSAIVPLSQAVEMTLSGQYPCALCKAIAERKNTENDKLATISKQGAKQAAGVLRSSRHQSPGVAQDFPAAPQFLNTRTEPPPLPPPRLA